MLKASDLETILAKTPGARVGVLGDFCLDVYWMLDMDASEVSLETGKRTQPVREQRYALGGAGNVVANLAALRVGRVSAFGAVGTDPFGERLVALLAALNADCDGMLQVDDAGAWQTLAYCKPYAGEEELPRLDLGNFNRFPDAAAVDLLQRLEEALGNLDIVIVNQQVSTGIHTPYFRGELRALMQRYPGSTFVFDGRHYTDSYPEAWLKVNSHEALRLCGREKDPQELVLRPEAMAAARELYERNRRPAFVTRGSRGCLVCTGAGVTEVPGLQTTGPTDPVGAGDSFLAGLSAALAAGATPEEAAAVGNLAARVTVMKLRQTGTASPEEILAVGGQPSYVYEPELADDPRLARYWENTHLEIVHDIPAGLEVTYALFDHDGTISTLRQGWEAVMEPMMVRAILGPHYATADEGLYHKIVERVRRFIDETTGLQTLAQMQGLVDMVRAAGVVPEKDILDLHGYKAIYNEALMARVRERLARLEKGELSVQDFTLKNAVELLTALYETGVQLFLVSGTDQADVNAEAEALGYAELFEGRIYGAVGDVTQEAKRVVLERLLKELGNVSGRLVAFGDGPVEIRETRQRGGVAIGVASDEVRRFDLNPAKRSRLIRAGAAIIVPDYSQLPELLRLLRIGAG